jgi:hypothetical protein
MQVSWDHPMLERYDEKIRRKFIIKSTLVNELVMQKVSIVSRKAQTTRGEVLGVFSDNNMQLVFSPWKYPRNNK